MAEWVCPECGRSGGTPEEGFLPMDQRYVQGKCKPKSLGGCGRYVALVEASYWESTVRHTVARAEAVALAQKQTAAATKTRKRARRL